MNEAIRQVTHVQNIRYDKAEAVAYTHLTLPTTLRV